MVAAESGVGGEDPGESEMDGGALVVTVLATVLDREVYVHVHAALRQRRRHLGS